MRDILFRGKDKNNIWHKGFYCSFNDKSYRIYTGFAETDCGNYYPNYTEINPKTVGQYIGLNDTNDAEIFEGDFVLAAGSNLYMVRFEECCFQLCGKRIYYNMSDFYAWDLEVVGNIYDNPELLSGLSE